MLIGDPSLFAIESEVLEWYDRPGQLALGFFVLHVGGRMYGVRERDATLLACSRDAIVRRLKEAGTHSIPAARLLGANEIARAYVNHVYGESSYSVTIDSLSTSDFVRAIETLDIVMAPDGDEAFDDGSKVLQFDDGQRVRLIAFLNEDSEGDKVISLSDVSLDASVFYETLDRWLQRFDDAREKRSLSAPPFSE